MGYESQIGEECHLILQKVGCDTGTEPVEHAVMSVCVCVCVCVCNASPAHTDLTDMSFFVPFVPQRAL